MGKVRIVSFDLGPAAYTVGAANQLITLSECPISILYSAGFKGNSPICGEPVRFAMSTDGVAYFYCDTANIPGAIRGQFIYFVA
ncbi:hypothetical protein [Lacrimispora sp.]|uniref:hypothetical protein n=1 Tax=Lacrimispora sp. TaxID=2719234 RepID=UPI0034604568